MDNVTQPVPSERPATARPALPSALTVAIVFLGATNLVMILIWLATIWGTLAGYWLSGGP